MGQKVASLEIELAMATGGAVSDLNRFGGVVDKVSAQAIRDLDRIDAAMMGAGGMAGPTAEVVKFAEQTAKSAVDAARDFGRIESAGERMAAKLERQLSVYGKTSTEIRAMKAETAALASEQAGQSELAGRIRAAERALWEAEYAEIRRVSAATNALAEDKAAAAAQAQRAADVEAKAAREAAFAYQMFETRVREGAAALREQEAAAARDANILNRLRELLDPASVAQDRLNKEMAEAQRVMLAAGHSAEEVARAQGLLSAQQLGTTRSTGQVKAGMQQLSYNLNDMATMWAMQAKPMQIFSSQAGQLIQAIQLMTGESKGFLGLLAGPWGLAITTAVVALAPLVAKYIEGNHALDDAVDKLKKDAAETAIDARAKTAFAHTIAGVTEAIRAETEARKQAIASQREAYELDYLRAQFQRRNAEASRATVEASLINARLLLAADKERAAQAGGDLAGSRVSSRIAEIRALEGQLKGLDKSIAAARALETGALADAAVATAKKMVDPLARINALYDGRRNAATAAAEAAAASGKTITGALTLELAGIERNRQAAIEAEQARTNAAKETQKQIGRNITLSEARGIAEGIGGRVTSDHRSLAEQQRLYAKYQAYQAGTGPWAALAAKPGTSNHEMDRAVDIAKGDGITLKKLVAAYRAAGVSLVEALDEGSHYHIAWKAVGSQARQETSARTDALKAVKDAEKFNNDLLEQHGDFIADQHRYVAQLMEQWAKPIDTGPAIDPTATLDANMGRIENWMDHHGPIALMNKALEEQAAWWDDIGERASEAASNMERAFGRVGGAIGDATVLLAEYGKRQFEIDRSSVDVAEHRRRSNDLQLSTMVGLTGAAKSFFGEHSKGFKAMEAAEKALTLVQLARTAIDVAGGAARMFAQLGAGGFPAVVAMGAVMAGLGFAVATGGGGSSLPATNQGTGTVLGDSDAQSESITRAIEQLADIDKVTMTHSASMLASLRSIDQKIGGLASLLVRTGDINASGGVNAGFKTDAAGGALSYLASGGALGVVLKQIPVLGDVLSGISGVVKSLFGTKTSVVASGLFGGPQTIADVLNAGFDASYFSDVKKTKKFFGISAGTKYSTQYGDADGEIEQQFGLILRGFVDTIGAAAAPLGLATGAVEDRLKGFVVDLGKIDLQGLTGEEISEKLTAVFGKAADDMARAAMPGLEQFQRVGEGYFETLTRVAVTMETVSTSLGRLGSNAQGLSLAAGMGVAGLFDSLSDLTSASDAYFTSFYSDAEQSAIRTAEMGKAFAGLGLAMPNTLAGYRTLVEAQDLTTAAGQQMYATLLQLAPAFADLKGAMEGAASAAAIVRQREDLESQILRLAGDTAAIRAAELAKIDPSNRALQQQVWAVQDAQEAAKAAEQLRDAWGSVGDSIMDEVKRIRGLTDVSGGGTFASLMGQFNAANAAAKGGDIDAAKNLPQLSKSLLDAAALAATSRQELDRVQAQTAAMLEATYAAIGGRRDDDTAATGATTAMLANLSAAQAATGTASTNDSLLAEIKALREEVTALRNENNAGHAATARNTGSTDRRLADVTAASGGDAITVASAA